jgi:hypothetical protein
MEFHGEQDVCHNRNAWKAIAQMRSGQQRWRASRATILTLGNYLKPLSETCENFIEKRR